MNLDTIRLVSELRNIRNRPELTDDQKSALTSACAILMAADNFVTDVESNVRDYAEVTDDGHEARRQQKQEGGQQ